MDIVAGNLGRRNFLRTGLGGAALSLSSCSPIEPARKGEGGTPAAPEFADFSRVVDLTHTYSNRFTHWAGGTAKVELEPVFSTAKGDGWNVTRWTLDEHAGTHIDSPFHRNPNGLTADRIPARDLVLPLAIIAIRKTAEENEDAQVTIEDRRAWEETHGPLPERCCVAMLSGWDTRVEKPGFINLCWRFHSPSSAVRIPSPKKSFQSRRAIFGL
ncbi:MAG: cyclase family protein [Planctomycetes bacterium]|nr:cyclase family protein [Planctomycetota bacterium]